MSPRYLQTGRFSKPGSSIGTCPANAHGVQGAPPGSGSTHLAPTELPPLQPTAWALLPQASCFPGSLFISHHRPPGSGFCSPAWTSSCPGPSLPAHCVMKTFWWAVFGFYSVTCPLSRAPNPTYAAPSRKSFLCLTYSHQFNSAAVKHLPSPALCWTWDWVL